MKIEYRSLDDENGYFDSAENTIYIDSKLPDDQRDATLFHEVFHACNTTIGDTPLGHALVDSLAEQLYQVFADNDLLR